MYSPFANTHQWPMTDLEGDQKKEGKRGIQPPHPYWLNKFAANHFTNALWEAIEAGGNAPIQTPSSPAGKEPWIFARLSVLTDKQPLILWPSAGRVSQPSALPWGLCVPETLRFNGDKKNQHWPSSGRKGANIEKQISFRGHRMFSVIISRDIYWCYV